MLFLFGLLVDQFLFAIINISNSVQKKIMSQHISYSERAHSRSYKKTCAMFLLWVACFYKYIFLYKSSSTSLNMGLHLFYLICESSIHKTIIITMKFISKNNTRNMLHEIWVTRLVTLVLSCHPLQPNSWAWGYFGSNMGRNIWRKTNF